MFPYRRSPLGESSPGIGNVSLVVVRREEGLVEVLERIRTSDSADVTVDVRSHALLREGGHARRLLGAAAADLGKQVSFRSDLPVPARAPRGDADIVSASVKRISSHLRPRRTLPPRPSARLLSQSRLRTPWSLIALHTLLAAATATAAVVLLFPRATVRLTVSTLPFVADLALTIAADTPGADINASRYPARMVVLEETLEEEVVVETVVETGARAAGSVDLVNETESAHSILVGSRLRNGEGITFRTLRGVLLPPQGRVSVPVRAEHGGEKANLSPQRLTLPALQPSSQRVLYAEIRSALSGGTDRPIRQVSKTDVDRAVARLQARARSLLEERAVASLGTNGSILVHDGLARIRVRALGATPSVGESAENTRVRATVHAEMLAVEREGLEVFLRNLLEVRAADSALPAGPGSVPRRILSAPNLADLRVVGVRWDEARAELSLHVETRTMPALEAERIAQLITGYSRPEAEQRLRSLGVASDLRVTLVPPFLRKLPRDARKIRVVLEPS